MSMPWCFSGFSDVKVNNDVKEQDEKYMGVYLLVSQTDRWISGLLFFLQPVAIHLTRGHISK
jgi:hypothetical protein